MAVEIVTKEDLNEFGRQLIKEIKALMAGGADQPEEWLRSSEVRRILKVSPGTLQNLRINGVLRFVKVGGIMFYKWTDLQKMMEKGAGSYE